jgi:uncharacterized phage infection (PIP) family protein YhgE
VQAHNQGKTMAESKKEAFRKYLESAGAIDTLTRVLVSLYEETDKPTEATDFIKASLGAPTPEQFNKLEAENNKLQGDLEAVQLESDQRQQEIEQLKARIAELEASAEKA